MRKLYLQIYLAFIAIWAAFFVSMIGVFALFDFNSPFQSAAGVGNVVNEFILPSDQSKEDIQSTIEQLAESLDANVTVRSSSGELVATEGAELQLPDESDDRAVRFGPGPTTAIRLPDSRWLLFGAEDHPRYHPGFIALGLLFLIIAIGALPLARRITRRIEHLQTSVEALGAGDLSNRVSISGKDEVAVLARSFNRAADRIERLVNAQRQVLAGVSHEIRTPLARIRLALELLDTRDRPELGHRIVQDLAELDDLISELLIASRLETIEQMTETEDIDLLALVAEEAARTEAEVTGAPTAVIGEPRMLRRLIRNLLENAQRYGGESPVTASVHPDRTGGAILSVSDLGPGVAPEEQELIFQPFYRAKQTLEQNDKGVGLGLSLVRTIARRHGGEVTCKPGKTKGTTFEVVLPSNPR